MSNSKLETTHTNDGILPALAFRLSVNTPTLRSGFKSHTLNYRTGLWLSVFVTGLCVFTTMAIFTLHTFWPFVFTCAAFTPVFLWIKRMYGKMRLTAMISRTEQAVRVAIEPNTISTLAKTISSCVKSQYGNTDWAIDADKHLNTNPYLYVASVITHKAELWDTAASRVYEEVIVSV